MKYTILSLIICSLITSCEHKSKEKIEPAQNTNDTISFSKNIQPIMETYCYGDNMQKCHVSNGNQGAPGDFTIYLGLKAKVDNNSIALRVFNTAGGMPPTYSNSPKTLTDKELKEFKLWVEQGALNN